MLAIHVLGTMARRFRFFNRISHSMLRAPMVVIVYQCSIVVFGAIIRTQVADSHLLELIWVLTANGM